MERAKRRLDVEVLLRETHEGFAGFHDGLWVEIGGVEESLVVLMLRVHISPVSRRSLESQAILMEDMVVWVEERHRVEDVVHP